MYALLVIDMGEGKTSEVYHVFLTLLSFGKDSFASPRPVSEIYHPLTGEKITSVMEDSARGAQLSLVTHHRGLLIQFLLLVLT